MIDLSAVTSFGALGVALLVHTARRAWLSGSVLRLVVTQRSVLWPMEITGVIGDFHIHDSVRAALIATRHQAARPRPRSPVVIASPRDRQRAARQPGSTTTRPFDGIAGAHQRPGGP